MNFEDELNRYIATANARGLPADVEVRTRMHLLDTLAAIVSGRFLPPGDIAYKFAESLGGPAEATLLGSDVKVAACNAALANGMAGHADETDDSHIWGRFHPGCGIVPAALAVIERHGGTSKQFLNAIALGYDVGARICMSLSYTSAVTAPFSTHTIGTLFGGAAAAAAILDLSEAETRVMMSFAVQQASGLPYWNRDPDHIEKAFDFGGKGARDAVYSVLFAKAGMTAPSYPLTGERGFMTSFPLEAKPHLLSEELGTRFEIARSTLKKWCVGSPIQSVLDALEVLMSAHDFTCDDITDIELTMPSDRLHVVSDREIPTICVQHLTALMLVKGTLRFADAHDESLMSDPMVRAVRAKIRTIPSDELAAAKPERQSIIEITLGGGEKIRHHAKAVHGTPDNPMEADDVVTKTRDILSPYLPKTTDDLIDLCLNKQSFEIADLVNLCRT